ncbi:UDP-N-acetylmuramoyl-tripeptide--D-alanyl-D-alanine ligase [Leptolyngbya sp. FACHB-261]|uniref:UDP-N-acetylmuramoyl-tripeptide--D-alanyl-D- alanine ligase n=1 Tax=Leptolyngbya sp. FACHB-261 TaxID=2692806 RepID=UPI001689BD38|nr:UDP-N-acetylmuramoyl-tripeptide--D-alanyl-D-alanine ligase [Leptolyngbya sp. FACHB-261]MBD2103223.1 UDP-N-acetylmuramoyl-tripeptide--D-alanyl-D-alanine ligase [Leptolyngbya sp. FACHB-261]
MPCQSSLARIAEGLDAEPVGVDLSQSFHGVSTDTRSLRLGQLFVALRGENFDGHRFASAALAQGAVAVLADMPLAVPHLRVADTLKAYQDLAQWWRQQFAAPVIAITGSVGKTTTKELIAAVLATQGKVLKTQANYNNEIGVPKTLLELGPEHSYAVIEMGMRGAGEIARLSQIAIPDIAVITNVGTAHIGRLGSEQAIAEAKCELLASMPTAGTAVLNHDNARLLSTAATVWQGKTLTYGLEGGDLQGELLDPQTLLVAGVALPLPLPGRHNALNYLAALAVAQLLQVNWEPLKVGLSVRLPDGRAQQYQFANDVVILDETYNAGLESMLAALHLLSQTPGQRQIAVLGTMKELGERSLEFHRQVGAQARHLQLDRLLILEDGPEGEALAVGATPLPTERLLTQAALVERLQQLIQPGDRLLFKASHSVGLDRVVEQLRTTLANAS